MEIFFLTISAIIGALSFAVGVLQFKLNREYAWDGDYATYIPPVLLIISGLLNLVPVGVTSLWVLAFTP